VLLFDQLKINAFQSRYSRIQVLILDDFLISHPGNDRSLILFSLIKDRDELGTSTIFTSQYNPRTWISFLEINGNFAIGDSIRRRPVNNGYPILIEKTV
jgi:DNA replication protein DnaC